MKPLNEMSFQERAKLLSDLVPESIPGLLEFFTHQHKELMKDQQELAKEWNNGLFTFQSWLNFANSVQACINKKSYSLHKNSWTFSEQLFDGWNAFWSCDCVLKYTWQEKCPDNYRKAADLLFGEFGEDLQVLHNRLAHLIKDIATSIKEAAIQLLKNAQQPVVDIDTTEMHVFIGRYETTLSGCLQLTTLRVKDDNVFIETEGSGQYQSIEQLIDLPAEDQLEILAILQEHNPQP